jgi:hypothetical protein
MVSNVQPGDFCCVPISGPVGKLISLGEWLDGSGFTRYDHAEIYVGMADANGQHGYTFGAYPGGATLVPLQQPAQQLSGALWSSGHILLTPDQRTLIVNNALALKGTPYSSLDYFAIAAHRFNLPLPLLKEYVASTKHMICSQLVDYVYMESGIHLFNDGRWPGYVTPANLAVVIENNGAGIQHA